MALGRHVDTEKLIAQSLDHPVHKHMGKRSVQSRSHPILVMSAYRTGLIYMIFHMHLDTMFRWTCPDTRCLRMVWTPRSSISYYMTSLSLVSLVSKGEQVAKLIR